MRTPVNMVLTAMACCDTVVLFSNLIYTTHYTFVAFADCHPRHWSYGWAMFLIAHAHLSLVGHSSSVWLSVMLGLIRFLTLENRKKSASNHRNIGLKHSYCAIAVVLVSVTIFNSPNFLTYRIVEMRLNETCPVQDPSLKYAPSYVPGVSDLALVVNCLVFRLAFWISGIVFKIVPSMCLAFFAYRLSKVLKEVKNNRLKLLKGSRVGNHCSTHLTNDTLLVNGNDHSHRGSSKSLHSNYKTNSVRVHHRTSDRTDRTTRMLIMIVVVNVVTETPQGIMAILSGILADQYRQFVYNRLGDILDLLSLCGACTTFIIYCTMSGQFRTEFRRVFIPSWCSSWLAKRLRAASHASHTSMITKMTYLTANPHSCNDYNNASERSITMTVVGSTNSVRKFYPNGTMARSQSDDQPSALSVEVESPKKEYPSTTETTDESTELLEDVHV
uniref:G_PROTEIN_RECEP_F1_2 domain-containing protein n=1 Tax=Steinernema glaseri TaxID=37863 RepID=A0A1I7YF26_9BILA